MPKQRRFIKKAIKKPGVLSRQLGIPVEQNIPFKLLKKIVSIKPVQTINNPTKIGKRRITVTKLLKKRANFAIVLKRIKRK